MPFLDPTVALSSRQEAFRRHYTASGNAADAARRTGYAELHNPWSPENIERRQRDSLNWLERAGPFDPAGAQHLPRTRSEGEPEPQAALPRSRKAPARPAGVRGDERYTKAAKGVRRPGGVHPISMTRCRGSFLPGPTLPERRKRANWVDRLYAWTACTHGPPESAAFAVLACPPPPVRARRRPRLRPGPRRARLRRRRAYGLRRGQPEKRDGRDFRQLRERDRPCRNRLARGLLGACPPDPARRARGHLHFRQSGLDGRPGAGRPHRPGEPLRPPDQQPGAGGARAGCAAGPGRAGPRPHWPAGRWPPRHDPRQRSARRHLRQGGARMAGRLEGRGAAGRAGGQCARRAGARLLRRGAARHRLCDRCRSGRQCDGHRDLPRRRASTHRLSSRRGRCEPQPAQFALPRLAPGPGGEGRRSSGKALSPPSSRIAAWTG